MEYLNQFAKFCLFKKEWRRLPHIVSHIHLPLLQASQQIVELSEAAQIHQGLLNNKPVTSKTLSEIFHYLAEIRQNSFI